MINSELGFSTYDQWPDVMYLKMYIKSERFYQQPDNQALKDEDKYFSDYDEDLDDRKLIFFTNHCKNNRAISMVNVDSP